MLAGAPSSTLALAQLQDSLWADRDAHVDALVLAARVPELAARLRSTQSAGEIEDHQCLWPGAQPPERLAVAPYLVRLKQGTPFTAWLLQEAATGLPDWGVLLASRLSRLDLRRHARSLCAATLPDGQEIALDWMDPQVLRALLPDAPREQLEQILAPLLGLLWAEGNDWVRIAWRQGTLHSQRLTLIA